MDEKQLNQIHRSIWSLEDSIFFLKIAIREDDPEIAAAAAREIVSTGRKLLSFTSDEKED